MILKNLKKRIFTSFLLLALVFLIYSNNLVLVYSLIILGVLSIIEFLNISKKIFYNYYYIFTVNLFFIIYLFLYCFFFFFFSNFPQLKIILFSLLFGCIASDIGGFIFGKIFKGPKLTKISPNKTISGAIGSIIMTWIIISCSIFYFTNFISFDFFIISIFTSISCQLGDLLFSFLKRKAKIKDTGNFLPGHGGILDRLDGIFLGIPFGFISFILIY